MKTCQLRILIFMALCCDLGLFAKRLVNPFANLITDALHIPGGIGTSFSLMFLVVAAELVPNVFCASKMGAVQSALALGLGMVGSMGALSPVGYIVPGLVIDLVMAKTSTLSRSERMVLANAAASPCAAAAANCIVFRLHGLVLLLYLSVAVTSGAFCGLLGAKIAARAAPVIDVEWKHGRPMKNEVLK